MPRMRATALAAGLAALLVFALTPAAFGLSYVKIQPGEWKLKANAVQVTYSGKGAAIRINNNRRSIPGVSMIGVAGTGNNTTAKVDKWVRENHRKPAQVCALTRGRVSGFRYSLAINHLANSKATQGSMSARGTTAPGWRWLCMNFTVASRSLYNSWKGHPGRADMEVRNLGANVSTQDLFVDYVGLYLR